MELKRAPARVLLTPSRQRDFSFVPRARCWLLLVNFVLDKTKQKTTSTIINIVGQCLE